MKDNPEKNRLSKELILNIVLFQPEIPANTGNIARLCGAAMLRLHLIYPLGFSVDNKHLKRAGIDCWHEVNITYHKDFDAFLSSSSNIKTRIICFSKSAEKIYTEASVLKGAYLPFGPESTGLPANIRNKLPCYRIPIWGNVRSLNLSTSVGIVAYHYLHKMGHFNADSPSGFEQ
ncbi:MAG: tRNA (cytidine(34)-2'-O)-methyltransferase [Deltaproteobacteria bacterium]|jgi:tRNA (cytidine/uridine-2'-O-)-methyltransferase|nr:tRNA (cytidine(34)-2'-O)-methyltransferase [Deltaproteobacteria bacterium]